MDYKISNVQERDKFETSYGTMQSYAIALEGQTGWIALNQKPETPPPRIGDTVHGNIETATTKNGKEYKKFKKVNPNYQAPNAQSVAGFPSDKMDYIIKMLEELTGRRKVEDEVVPMPEPNAPEYDDPFAGIL